MIRQLTGTIAQIESTAIVLDVQGVGYLIHVTIPTEQLTIGTTTTFHTYLAVRETALDLYGFTDLDTLTIFEQLITLPKIGPKSAAQILGQASTALLKEAVYNQDPTYLSKMSGIGKKSAEKIILGLKEKFDTHGIEYNKSTTIETASAQLFVSDTIDALIALGYAPQDARKAVQELPTDITNTNEAVRAALKLLSN